MAKDSIYNNYGGTDVGGTSVDVGDQVTHHTPETPGGSGYCQAKRLMPGFNWANGGSLITTPNNMKIKPEIYDAAVSKGMSVDSAIVLENGNYAFGSTVDRSIALISPQGELLEIISSQQNQEA